MAGRSWRKGACWGSWGMRFLAVTTWSCKLKKGYCLSVCVCVCVCVVKGG